MVDLKKGDKENISLPKSLHSPDVQASDNPFNKEEEKVTIFNMQKTFYWVKIEDSEKRIKRLENRNQSMLEEYSSADLAFSLRDRETADDIMKINHEISREMNKIKADEHEIQIIEQLKLENKIEHERNIKTMHNMYKKTRIDLISKIKTLNAQINILEDFKEKKHYLSEKFIKNIELLEKNENVFKTNLNEIDRKFKIAKEKMMNELHERLLTIANDFQFEIMGRLSLSTQRLLRENITIQNDYSQIFNDTVFKEAHNLEIQYAAKICNNQLKENQRQTFLRLITCKIQENLISTLKSSNTKLKETLTTSKNIIHCAQERQKEFFEKLKTEENLDFQRRQLQVILHHIKVKINFALNKERQSRCKVKKLIQILNEITFTVSSAIKLSKSTDNIGKMTYKQLLHCLMNQLIQNHEL